MLKQPPGMSGSLPTSTRSSRLPATPEFVSTQRGERLNDEERQVALDKAHEHTFEHQQQSRQTASNHSARWKEWQDAIIWENPHLTDSELAVELGRTLYAVRNRKFALRRRALLERP